MKKVEKYIIAVLTLIAVGAIGTAICFMGGKVIDKKPSTNNKEDIKNEHFNEYVIKFNMRGSYLRQYNIKIDKDYIITVKVITHTPDNPLITYHEENYRVSWESEYNKYTKEDYEQFILGIFDGQKNEIDLTKTYYEDKLTIEQREIFDHILRHNMSEPQ